MNFFFLFLCLLNRIVLIKLITIGILGSSMNAVINEGEMIQNLINNVIVDVEIPLNWPTQEDQAIDEYSCTNLFAMSFPIEFPIGIGDCTSKIRQMDVFLNDSIKHYQYYSVCIDGKRIWPLASLHRFMFYLHDVDERRRMQSQASIYIKQDIETSSMSIL